MDTREKSANLRIDKVRELCPGLVERQTKQVRNHWKSRGVSWKKLALALLSERSDPAARASQQLPDATLSAPEDDMAPEDRRAWMLFIELLKHHDSGRQRQKWNAVRDVLLALEDAATTPARPRQGIRRKPALVAIDPAQ